jgi:flagellar hook-associated protein 1 FlgK
MPISPILSVARRALLANESALTVVGNNIANVNTPGYTRQVAELVSDPPAPNGLGVLVGGGMHVEAVTQVLDPLVARRLLGAGTTLGEHQAHGAQLEALARVASDLEEPSVASALGAFFDAADDFAQNPGGLAERQALLGRAAALASEVTRRSAALAAAQREADDRYVVGARRAAADVERIAALNRAIVQTEGGGQRANELRDQRQAALEDLAGLLGVSATEDEHGALRVAAANGLVLVDAGTVVHPVTVRAGAVGRDGLPLTEAGFADPAGGFVSLPAAFASGTLAGLAAARDQAVPAAAAALDALALALRDEVNAIQTDAAAFDLDGNGTAGAPLFAATSAADLRVALADPRRLAGALSTEPGDNQNALRLADLRRAPIAALGGVTFVAALAAEQARVGEDAARAADRAAASEAVQQQLVAQRAALSGVSLNEELTNLLRFQRAFQAASQVVGVADAMLGELLEVV